MSAISIISDIQPDLFSVILETSPRQVREVLFSRFGVKAKKKYGMKSFAERRKEKAVKLQDKLKACESEQEQELCSELIRNWLFTKRPMLKAALDFLKIENNDGLVEKDLDEFGKLNKSDAEALLNHLSETFPKEEALIYLQFMGVKL